MRKIITVLILLGFYSSTFAGGGFNSYKPFDPQAIFSINGFVEAHSLDDLHNYNYGTKLVGDTWLLKGGQATLVTDFPTTISSVTFYYRVYKEGNPTSWNSQLLDETQGYNKYGTPWVYDGLSFNILDHSLVDAGGTYYLEFYFEAVTSDDGTKNYYSSSVPAKARFTTTSALPVELTTFSAFAEENKVALAWETATEVNNYGFEVERASASSASEKNWEKISFVEGHGNSNSPKTYSYTDNTVTAGDYYYRLRQVDIDGQFEYSDVVEVSIAAPDKFELAQNYPNPFNPKTNISFSLQEATNVSLVVYNTIGQEVAQLVNQRMEAGTYNEEFDASNLNSGVYVYMLKTENATITRKMLLMK